MGLSSPKLGEMPTDNTPQRFGDLEPSQWPGERLGLPEKGPRSVGRFGRRLVAILIDWMSALLIARLLFPSVDNQVLSAWALLVFIVLQVVFIPTIGGSIGHRICGMRIVTLTGQWVGLWRPVVRTLLLAAIVPLLVWDSDQRAFHDKVAGTVLIRA